MLPARFHVVQQRLVEIVGQMNVVGRICRPIGSLIVVVQVIIASPRRIVARNKRSPYSGRELSAARRAGKKILGHVIETFQLFVMNLYRRLPPKRLPPIPMLLLGFPQRVGRKVLRFIDGPFFPPVGIMIGVCRNHHPPLCTRLQHYR